MNRDSLRNTPFPVLDLQPRRESVDSVSSAADRRRWRNHAHVLTPEPQSVERDPFDDFAVNLPPAPQHPNTDLDASDGKSSSESRDGEIDVEAEKEEEEEEEEENIDADFSNHGPRGGAILGGNGIEARKEDEPDPETTRAGAVNDSSATGSDWRRLKLPWRERIRHFTWTWFCLTMATGGIANVLYAVPFRFPGLYALGCVFFIGNMALFLFNVCMISCRFYFYPRTFRASFLHPTESLFIPAAIVSFGIIMMNISQYGVGMVGPSRWLQHVMIVLFWVDCGLAVTFSLGIYLIMFVRCNPPCRFLC
jgi:hypothetical protein